MLRLLVAGQVHREFGSFMFEGRVLLDNLGVLAQQLLYLDPAFTTCISFEEVVQRSEAGLRRLAAFAGVQDEAVVRTILSKEVKYTELQRKRQIRASAKKNERVQLMLTNSSEITNPSSEEGSAFVDVFERRHARIMTQLCPAGTFVSR